MNSCPGNEFISGSARRSKATAHADDLTSLLLASADRGDIAGVQRALDAAVDVNVVNAFEETALHRAASKGHAQVLRLLLTQGAQVNQHDKNNTTALMRAASQGSDGCVSVLLHWSADVNVVNEYRSTALSRAAQRGFLSVIQKLVDAGADVNHADASGYTPLMHAAYGNRPAAVHYLLENDAAVNALGPDRKPALWWMALARGRFDPTCIQLRAYGLVQSVLCTVPKSNDYIVDAWVRDSGHNVISTMKTLAWSRRRHASFAWNVAHASEKDEY
jgi:ankyrin repeat protein